MSRPRTRLSADEWARRLDECMDMVLRDPSRHHPAVVLWAQWRERWLRAQERREPREKVSASDGF